MPRIRRRRSPLEQALSECVIDSVKEHTPGLREAIREALDKGAPPAEIRRRYGAASRLRFGPGSTTALTVEWIVDEWEREKGIVKADESIDFVE